MPAADRSQRYFKSTLYVKIVSWAILFTGIVLLAMDMSASENRQRITLVLLIAGAVLLALSPAIGDAFERRKT